jgi:hypothetical protein
VVDLPVTVPVGLGKARSGVLDLVGVEFVVAIRIERVAKRIAPFRGRAVTAFRRLGDDELATCSGDGQDAKRDAEVHGMSP